MYTIELNIDDDPMCHSAWHIDDLDITIQRNLTHAMMKHPTERWQLVGIANSREEAFTLADSMISFIAEKQFARNITSEHRTPYSALDILFNPDLEVSRKKHRVKSWSNLQS